MITPGIVILLIALAFFVGYMIARQNKPPQTEQTLLPDLGKQEQKEIIQLLSANRKIEAIKRCRELIGCGLKEAKDIVEALEESNKGK